MIEVKNLIIAISFFLILCDIHLFLTGHLVVVLVLLPGHLTFLKDAVQSSTIKNIKFRKQL